MARGAEPEHVGRALRGDSLEGRAEHRDAQLDRHRQREQRPQDPQRGAGRELLAAAHIGDDEHIQDHHRARVHENLRGGDELGAQQQEQGRQADQVHDQQQHAVERVADGDDSDRARQRADRGDEEDDLAHSPSARSGVRSIGSASSISFVKIRSERV